jgi:hypothetical protein
MRDDYKEKLMRIANRISRDPLAYAQLLLSLQADIGGMRSHKTDDLFDGEPMFGPFSGEDYVAWPNLAIMLERLDETLDVA